MAEPVRIRVEFEDHRHLLTKAQRKDGLRRCWLLLGPHLPTVADLAAHLARSFALHRSCPCGFMLYMDEFVLPPFESTSIFRDNDIIRVRKKAGKLRQLLETCGNEYCIQDSENVAKQCMDLGHKILASQEFPEDSRANKRKKRKDTCDLQQIATNTTASVTEETNLKRKSTKKIKLSNTEEPIETAELDENIQSKQNEIFVQKKSSLGRNLHKKDGTSDGDGRCGSSFNGQIVDNDRSDTNSLATKNRSDRVRVNCHTSQPESHVNNEAKQGISSKLQPVAEIAVADDEVPMIVQPGHVRFQPIDKEQSKSLPNKPEAPSRWNRINKKGQNWHKGNNFSRRYDDNGCKKVYQRKLIDRNVKNLVDGINFEGLFPLTRLPKEGDVVVYRLVIPSASWYHELSPCRVGKVLSYNSLSMRIVLVPVPECPIFPNAKRFAEGSIPCADASVYKDDGTLEIDFPSLVDVRLLKANDMGETAANGMQGDRSKKVASANNWGRALVDNWELALSKANAIDSSAHVTEATPSSVEGQIDQDLSEKKQLQGNGWDCWVANKTITASWSWAVRGNATKRAVGSFGGKSGKYAPGKYANYSNNAKSKW